MNLQTAHYKIKSDSTADFEAAIKQIFAALQRTNPTGVRFSMGRLSDGATYLGLLQLDDGIQNPLPLLPEGQKFLSSIENWLAEPPLRDQPTILGSYRLF